MSRKKKAVPNREAALKNILHKLPGNHSARQCERLLDAMHTLGSITSYEASRFLDCYDPRARIFKLRREGNEIVTVMRHEETESGVPHRIGVWFLQAGRKA